MPIFESFCPNPDCPKCGVVSERYESRYTDADPLCPECSGQQCRKVSQSHVVFTGPITSRYKDKSLEGAGRDGHWAWRRKSSKSGNPEPVFIDSFETQRQYCKDEGLINPKDVGPTMMGSDGKLLSSTGLPGSWT